MVTIACEALLAEMHAQVGHIDLYNVYGSCISGSGAEQAGSGSNMYKAPLGPAGTSSVFGSKGLGGPDACIDSILASTYFNRPEVYEAIHVVPPTHRWATCGTAVSDAARWPARSNASVGTGGEGRGGVGGVEAPRCQPLLSVLAV